MEIVYEIEQGHIRGEAATIIKAVREKTIDLNYVFSNQFIYDWCDKFYDKQDSFLEDWLYSLEFINQVPYKARKEVFGFVTYLGQDYDGGDLSRIFIAKLYNEYTNGDKITLDWLDAYGFGAGFPHIIENSHFFKNTNFFLSSTTHQYSIEIQCQVTSIIAGITPDEILFTRGEECGPTQLMTLTKGQIEYPYYEYVYFCRGFAASLINAVVCDVKSRKTFATNFNDPKSVQLLIDKTDGETRITFEELPSTLCIPAKKLVKAYMQEAIPVLRNYLELKDIGYDEEDPMYVLRKMYEIESKEGGMPIDSEMWTYLDDQQRKMFLDYYDYFFNYLCDECGIERLATKIPNSGHSTQHLSDDEPETSFFSNDMPYEMCEQKLIEIINSSRSKSEACRKIIEASVYFKLSDKTDIEKANIINTWIKKTSKKFVFTRDDFRKARS